jgi:prevent-host-death family protein
MKTVSIRDAKSRLAEVERGQTVVVTRNGKPVFDLVPHRPLTRGLKWGAIAAFKRKYKVKTIVGPIPYGFDDPLPEDFLIRPLP